MLWSLNYQVKVLRVISNIIVLEEEALIISSYSSLTSDPGMEHQSGKSIFMKGWGGGGTSNI